MAAPEAGDTLVAAALKVMLQPDPWLKAAYTQQAVQLWQTGAINRQVKSQLSQPYQPCQPMKGMVMLNLLRGSSRLQLGT